MMMRNKIGLSDLENSRYFGIKIRKIQIFLCSICLQYIFKYRFFCIYLLLGDYHNNWVTIENILLT